jgi:hypothetical protein
MNTNLDFKLAPLPELEPSPLLDYAHPSIEQLIVNRGWNLIEDEAELIKGIYLFVRDEIAYGYTKSFAIPASQVLCCKCGNGITKSTLFMALLRAVGIPCRFQAMTMSKVIFRGLLSGLTYKIADKSPFRARVELQFKGKWYPVEGYIIDSPYMLKLQQRFVNQKGSFYGYGIAALDFKNPDNLWNGNHIFVQNKAIEKNLGTFDTPDAFFQEVPRAESYAKCLRYKAIICDRLNRSIQKVRDGV